MASDLFILLIMIAGVFYWLNAMRCKELAREAGKVACKKYDLIFLDDTVVIQKIRLRRSPAGSMKLYREYQFEFTSDGVYRYKGVVSMTGKLVKNINMDAYHLEA